MNTYFQETKPSLFYKCTSICVAVTFMFSVVIPPPSVFAQAAPTTALNLPIAGTMVPLTSGFNPPMVNGMTIHPDDPFKFDFLIGRGDNHLEGEEFTNEANKLIKYFLASLTVPQEELWVNLSPYEEDRIIPESLSKTEMGRDLLAQDYILKQLTASLMYPENELGERFWNRIHQKVREQHGVNDLPIDTFNKVWIVPQNATVYESRSTVVVIDSYLKVMLEGDYFALQSAKDNYASLGDQSPQSTIIREVIVPAIEKEVNEGETFANLRQIYNSMILATWYKQNLRESLLGKAYVDQKKVSGIDTVNEGTHDEIYQQYLEAFKVGVYNYIREEYDSTAEEVISRKYFAGGITSVRGVTSSPVGQGRELAARAAGEKLRNGSSVTIELQRSGPLASSPVKGDETSDQANAPISYAGITALIEEIKFIISNYGMQHPPDEIAESSYTDTNIEEAGFEEWIKWRRRAERFISDLPQLIDGTFSQGAAVTALRQRIVEDVRAISQRVDADLAVVGRSEMEDYTHVYYYPKMLRLWKERVEGNPMVKGLLEGANAPISYAGITALIEEIKFIISNYGMQHPPDEIAESSYTDTNIEEAGFEEWIKWRRRAERFISDLPQLIDGTFSQGAAVTALRQRIVEEVRVISQSVDADLAVVDRSEREDYTHVYYYPDMLERWKKRVEGNPMVQGLLAADKGTTAASPVGEADATAVGGIDLDSEHLNLKVKRDGNGIPLPVPLQPIEIINVNGLVPVIINVAPVNIPLILGAVIIDDIEPYTETKHNRSLDSVRNEYFDQMIDNDELAEINS